MPGVAITSTLPDVGSTPSPTWADDLITWCNEVQADIEAAIVPSEITINADVEFNNNSITELTGLRFNSLALSDASSGASNSSMLEVVLGELRFIDGSGNNIQLTSGGSLNITTAGGIGGDYIGSIADVSYNSSTNTYTFSDETGPPVFPAKMDHGSILLRYESSSSNAITIKAPSGTAAYSLVLPDDVGSGQQLLTATTAGSVITLDTTTYMTTRCNFGAGVTFATTGAGDEILDFYEDTGGFGTEQDNVGGLDWVPVVTHAGVAAETDGLIRYAYRYAWLQRIGNWCTLFARIDFYCTWDSGALSAAAPIIITGVPYKAWFNGGGGGFADVITAYGEVYEFPRTAHAHDYHAGGAGGSTQQVTSDNNSHAPNDSTLHCYMRNNDNSIYFYPTSMTSQTTTYGAARMPALAYAATGWGISGNSPTGGSRAEVSLSRETAGTPTTTSNLTKIHTVAFKMHYRVFV